MVKSRLESLKVKAKLLQKAKKKAGKPVLLKEALGLVAKSAGYESWRDLKKTLDETGVFSPPRGSAYWNVWYSKYDEARDHLSQSGGFLLPFERHFFICDINYIESLGIKRGDPDLEKVGFNWVEPLEEAAWSRLLERIRMRQKKT